MPIYTLGGNYIVDSHNLGIAPKNASAINNVDFGGTIERIIPNAGDPPGSAQIWARDITIPSGVKKLQLVWRGKHTQGTADNFNDIYTLDVEDYDGIGSTDVFLGVLDEILRRGQDSDDTLRLFLYPVDANGNVGTLARSARTGYEWTDVDDDDVDGVVVTVTADPVITTDAEDCIEFEPFSFTPVATEGTDAQVRYTFYTNDTNDTTTPTENTEANKATHFPAITSGRKYYYIGYEVWGFGVEESSPITGISNIVEILESEDTPPAQLTSEQWRIPVGIAKPAISANAFGMDSIEVLDSINATEVQWTTQLNGTDEELSWEDCTFGGLNGSYRIFTTNVATGNDGWDYSKFDFVARVGDISRASRVRIRYKTAASSLWSPSTVVKRCEAPTTEVSADFWQKITLRSKEQHDSRARGGCGYQFARSVGYSAAMPNRVWFTMDVLPPIKTESFGDLYEHPLCTGLLAGRSGEGCAIDSEDGNRILLMHTGSSQRGKTNNLNVWDDVSGIYLSTDGGDNFTLVKALPSIAGSGEKGSDSRFSRNAFCEIPDATKTPTTRIWYAFHRKYPKGAASATNTQIYKSTNGGQTWNTVGSALSPATYGSNITFLKYKPQSGWFYLGSQNGKMWISKDNCVSWTQLNAPTGGEISDCDTGGVEGEIWICVDGSNKGLYKHTNNGEGAVGTWSQKFTGTGYHHFAINPHNRNTILVAGGDAKPPKRSLNGQAGTPTWSTIPSDPYPGQPNNFAHQVWGSHSQFLFHATDASLCLAIGKSHNQICRNINSSTGRFVYGSHGFDCHNVQNAAEDPDNPGELLLCVTDRLGVYSHDGVYVTDSTNDDTFENNIESVTGTNGHVGNAGGSVWLRSPDGTKQAKVVCVGVSQTNAFAPVRFTGTASNPIATGTVINVGSNKPTKGGGCALKRSDNSKGLLGRWELSLANNDTLTVTDMGLEMMGYDAQGRKYGVALDTAVIKRAGNDNVFSNFCTCVTKPITGDAGIYFDVDQNHDNRLIYPTNNGRLMRVTGAPGNQTENTIFDLRNYLSDMPSGWDWAIMRFIIDQNGATPIVYVSSWNYGRPHIWRTLDYTVAGDNNVVWEDISHNSPRTPTFFSMAEDGTVIIGSLSGCYCASKPGGTESALYSAVKTYNSQIIEQ